MTNISSYVDYLPSVLWSQENDPSQFMGRMLRIFEKILTGISMDAQAIRARAAIKNAVNNKIQLVNVTDSAKFRAGDIISIEGTTERVRIDHIQGTEIFLTENLTGSYENRILNIRINDLISGQTTFRIDNIIGLKQGSVIRITQGTKSEERKIQKLTDNFITLNFGLTNTYSMALTDVPVGIEDRTTIEAEAIRTRATIKNAVNNTIQLVNVTDSAKFRTGDIISIEGTTERVGIDHIQGTEIFLTENLTGSYENQILNIRINDLISGQTTFRVDNVAGLESESIVKITQGTKSEERKIQKLTDNFITLNSGLTNTYSMALTDAPVKIQDGTTAVHGANKYDNFEKTIDELHQIFNPWHTDFLPWLASWVALTLQKNWSEYQQRKLISEIVSIYQERGLKKGLHTYLDIYAVTEAKPRIAIDDGDAIFRCTFLDNGTAILHTVAHSSAILGQDSMITALLHPSAIAADTNNDYIVVDQGNTSLSFYQGNTLLKSPQQPSLWKVSSMGEIEYKSIPDMPMPIPHSIYSGSPLVNPTAVVIKQNKYIVLDTGKFISETTANSAIYRVDSGIETIISRTTNPPSPAVYPVDMILDSSERLVVLDRGIYPTGEFSGSPSKNSGQKIIVVREEPLAVEEHRLKEVVEPTALAMNSMGRFIVADAKNQSESDPAPADLIMVDPTAGWSEFSLLDSIPRDKNPLIFPTGLAFENPQTLLVCDTGVRLGFDEDEAYRTMAEPAAIYRITNLPQTPPASDLPQTQPTITRVTYERKLVNPTKMMIDRKGKLIIADKGEYIRSTGDIPSRNWRAKANEFGVVVYFSQQRPTTFDDRNRTRRGIESVVDEQKPGHVSWWMKS